MESRVQQDHLQGFGKVYRDLENVFPGCPLSQVSSKKLSPADVFEEAAYYAEDVVKYNRDTDFFRVIQRVDKHNRVVHNQVGFRAPQLFPTFVTYVFCISGDTERSTPNSQP